MLLFWTESVAALKEAVRGTFVFCVSLYRSFNLMVIIIKWFVHCSFDGLFICEQ